MDFAASVILTAWREPPERLNRLLAALAEQDVDGDIELVLAVEPEEAASLQVLRPSGALKHIRIVENPGGARSSGLNRAVQAAAGEIVCRLDARSLPPRDHVRRCAARLRADARVGVAGGAQRPVPAARSARARGIARALANPWLLGAPAYRRKGAGGRVDTVYLGSFRRRELLDMGGYDERLDANEDFELAQRYRQAGRLVWLEEGLDVGYEARATVLKVFHQYVAFGRSKVRYWRVKAQRPNARQRAALALSGSMVGVLTFSASRPRRLVTVATAMLAATIALDHIADPHERGLKVRVFSIVASWAVVGGWLSGVAAETLSRQAEQSRIRAYSVIPTQRKR